LLYNIIVKKPVDSIKAKVLGYLRANGLVTAGEKIVVAVSGGPDSVCLLDILYSLRKELGIELHVAHLNHQLRGAEADADADYVKALARRLKLPATIESADVRSFQKKHKLTLEEAAREVRYGFLAAVAQKTGAEKVAVGHTAADNVETLLMHIIRGSGLKGLRGLLPDSQIKAGGTGLRVIRPLLCLTREETEDYCAAHRLNPRTDSTNLSAAPFRNKVRRRLLPQLRGLNPQFDEALLRTAATAAADLAFIEQEANLASKKLLKSGKNSVTLDKQGFLALHPALQRQVLRGAIESLLGSLKDIEAVHVEDIMDALEKPAGKIIGLPFGLNFYIDYDRYILTPETASAAAGLCPLPTLNKSFKVNIPGKTRDSGWEVEASFVTPLPTAITEGGFIAYLDAAVVGKELTVRNCLPADRFQPLGMKLPKKLNRFMMDAHIPRGWRKNVPLVCAGNEIIWVAGWRISERCRIKPDTEKVLKLEFKQIQEK
jgi:tRNA(Ile)-lysidine synthase